jgi:excisionase family DNA binding protein
MPETGGDTLLKTTEAATLAGVSIRTLYRWEALGYIAALRTPSGHRRFRRSDVEALLTEPEGVA